jgi:hypothetical protein
MNIIDYLLFLSITTAGRHGNVSNQSSLKSTSVFK